MLLIVQYPIADLRRWYSIPRLDTPHWITQPTSTTDEFVRHFGRFGSRHSGGVSGIFGESNKTDCKRGIRFHDPIFHRDISSGSKTPLWCTFRRLYFDGFATGRIEIGITNHRQWKEKPPKSSSFKLEELVSTLEQIRVTIHGDVNLSESAGVSLLALSQPLTKALFYATVPQNHQYDVDPALNNAGFDIGSASIYLRFADNEEISFDTENKETVLIPESDRRLSVVQVSLGKAVVPIWLQKYTLPIPAPSLFDDFDFDHASYRRALREGATERELRVLLSRFCAEQHTVQFFQQVANRNNMPAAKGDAAAFLDEFFELSLAWLNFGSGSSEVGANFERAQKLHKTSTQGRTDDLLREMQRLAMQRREAKNKRGVSEYLKSAAKFLAEVAAKAGVEALVKHYGG